MPNDIHTIPESSETESFSERYHSQEDSTTLDDLFAELEKETQTSIPIEDYRSIEKSIRNLPKIKENLVLKSKKESIKIYDPIVVPKKQTETTDARWFNMKQPEMTPEIKRDLQIIKQRSALDPKRHYKKDKWEIPKYFQMGTIIEGNTEFYSARLKKKERGKTMVEELLNDDNTKKYFKRKYHEIQETKTSGRKGHYKKVKNARKKY
ncbi:MAG: Fcf2 domain-containing protein [Asgard group archaeon]|nr:Fcf2 domain-containing protein [Asgard group archaeon]